MREEIRILLKDELKKVQTSKISILIGGGMVILNIILVILSILSVYSLFFIIPIFFIIKKLYLDYQIDKAMLFLTRTLIDDEFNGDF